MVHSNISTYDAITPDIVRKAINMLNITMLIDKHNGFFAQFLNLGRLATKLTINQTYPHIIVLCFQQIFQEFINIHKHVVAAFTNDKNAACAEYHERHLDIVLFLIAGQ